MPGPAHVRTDDGTGAAALPSCCDIEEAARIAADTATAALILDLQNRVTALEAP